MKMVPHPSTENSAVELIHLSPLEVLNLSTKPSTVTESQLRSEMRRSAREMQQLSANHPTMELLHSLTKHSTMPKFSEAQVEKSQGDTAKFTGQLTQ